MKLFLSLGTLIPGGIFTYFQVVEPSLYEQVKGFKLVPSETILQSWSKGKADEKLAAAAFLAQEPRPGYSLWLCSNLYEANPDDLKLESAFALQLVDTSEFHEDLAKNFSKIRKSDAWLVAIAVRGKADKSGLRLLDLTLQTGDTRAAVESAFSLSKYRGKNLDASPLFRKAESIAALSPAQLEKIKYFSMISKRKSGRSELMERVAPVKLGPNK